MPTRYRPSQMGDTRDTPVPYTAHPLRLLWGDVRLFWRWLYYIPYIVYPLFRHDGNRMDELYPSLANTVAVLVHIFLFFAQCLFFFWLPLNFFLSIGGSWIVLYVTGFLMFNYVVCRITLNYRPRVVQSRYERPELDDHEDERWIFINGITTGSHWLQNSIDLLSQTFYRRITGIHNRTNGFIFDIIECLIQRAFCYETRDVRIAYAIIKDALLDEGNRKVILILHSQGGIEGSLIVDWLLSEISQDRLEVLEIYTFGNAANHFNDPRKRRPIYAPGQHPDRPGEEPAGGSSGGGSASGDPPESSTKDKQRVGSHAGPSSSSGTIYYHGGKHPESSTKDKQPADSHAGRSSSSSAIDYHGGDIFSSSTDSTDYSSADDTSSEDCIGSQRLKSTWLKNATHDITLGLVYPPHTSLRKKLDARSKNRTSGLLEAQPSTAKLGKLREDPPAFPGHEKSFVQCKRFLLNQLTADEPLIPTKKDPNIGESLLNSMGLENSESTPTNQYKTYDISIPRKHFKSMSMEMGYNSLPTNYFNPFRKISELATPRVPGPSQKGKQKKKQMAKDLPEGPSGSLTKGTKPELVHKARSGSSLTVSRAPIVGEQIARGNGRIPYIEHYANSKDFVSLIGVLNFHFVPNRFMGQLFNRQGWGHLFNQHYMATMFAVDFEGDDDLANNQFMREHVMIPAPAPPAPAREDIIVGDPHHTERPVWQVSRLWRYRKGRSPSDEEDSSDEAEENN